jgi:hypothetical protein
MFLELFLNVLDFIFGDFSSADGTALFLWHFELDFAAELVLLAEPVHEPVPVDANQVESVEALVHPHQIYPVCELLLPLL